MAQKVTVSLVDDLDGAKADETVQFSLDHNLYEIDLSSGNAGKLRSALAEFIDAARKPSTPPVGARRGTSRRASASVSSGARSRSREETQAIRDWAREQGEQISDRGRIPIDIQLKYDRAQKAAKAAR